MWPRTDITRRECLKVLSCTSSEHSAKEQVSVIHISNEFMVQLKVHLKAKFK